MKNFFTFLLALSFSIGFAQEFKIESSTQFEKNHENEVTEVVFATPYGFSTYSYLKNVFLDNQKEITITKYDQQLQQAGTIRFNLPKLEQRAADLDKVIELEKDLIFISNSMSKKQGIRNIYAQVYNLESNAVSELKIIASYPIESYSKSGQVEVNVSENKQQIVVLANMPFVKKTQEKVKVWVFNTNLDEQWNATHTIGLDSERAHNQDVHVANDGTVHLVKRHKYSTKKATSTLVTINGDNKTETLISTPNFFVRNTTLVNVGTDNLLAGFYYEGKVPYVKNTSDEGNETSGVFLYSINDSKIIGQHKFMVDGKPVKDLASVTPVFTHVFGDDLFIVGEKQTYSSKFKEGNSTELDYMYTHGPTAIIHLNTNGTLKEMNVLNNANTFKNAQSERASVAALPMNGGVKLFYNKSTFTVAGFYDNAEKTTYNTLPTKYKDNTSTSTSYLVPKSLKAVDNYNLIYFVATNGNRYWLNKMTWE
ncbi:hypothetical protein ACFQ1Q_11790 [Winogradskyella litorisediminis]|uniref:Uncharacterized protein n=1 Tax=Winogradskyella litorisediminis TaxID=1156618 RepID=A0ABW3NAB2_9FLAO